mmetsp:Transcript_45743/g.106197  ORF Transcript_45743/g.106197 Transcript_45743/m.106197 type:complete len:552 (-) Transcript_45743:68-1723(-)
MAVVASAYSLHEALHDAKERVARLKVEGPSPEEVQARSEVVRLFWDIGNKQAAVTEAQHAFGRARLCNDNSVAARSSFIVALVHAASKHDAQAREAAANGLAALGESAAAEEPLVNLLARLGDAAGAQKGKLENQLIEELDPAVAEELYAPSLQPALTELAMFRAQDAPAGVTKLRGIAASPASGTVDSVAWMQTAGRITLECPLDSTDCEEKDVEVMVSSWQLQVKVKGARLEDMCGEFCNDVIREGCWWRILRRAAGTFLSVSIAKKAGMVWSAGPWNAAPLNPRRAQTVAWTAEQREELALKENVRELIPVSSGSRAIQEVAPGYLYPSKEARMLAPKSKQMRFTADDLCIGIDVRQDRFTVTAEVHFDRFALDWAERELPYEDLLAADVWADGMYVFLLGDELNPLLWVEFDGTVVPEKTTWAITTTDKFRSRQRNPGDASPTLRIKCVKAPRSVGMWSSPFTWCGQTRLAYCDADQSIRFEAMPGAYTLRRAGYDPEEPDFADFVEELLADVMGQTGHLSAQQQRELLREVMERIASEATCFEQAS